MPRHRRNRRKIVTGREWLFALAWGVVLIGVTSLPYGVGVLASTPEKQFGGFVYNVFDCNSYVAKMRQGARGEWLFTLPYTSEPHQGALIYPFYLLLGKVAAWSGLPLLWTYHLARPVCTLGLVVSVYAFVARFTRWLPIRRMAFLLALFSSGLGWLLTLLGLSPWLGDMPIDFWVAEGYLFLLAYAMPHLAFGGALLFGLLSLVLDAWRQGAWHLAVLSGGIGLALTAILPFYSAVAYVVLGMTWLVESVCLRRANMRRFWMLLLSGAFSVPVLAYQVYVFTCDPFFRAWASQNLTRSPNALHYLLGYALLLVLSAGGVVWVLRRGDRSKALPLVWLLIAPLLVYMPVRFQRRFLIGFQVPLSLFGAIGFVHYVLLPLRRLRLARWLLRWPRYSLSGLRRWVATALIVFASATNVLLVAGACAGAWAQSPLMFHERAELDALDWLRTYTKDQDVVLCAFETGNFVPARAGNRVFLGHGPETVRSDAKAAMVARFFDAATADDWRRSLLRAYRIAYVVVGPRERALGAFAPDRASYLYRVYAHDGYAIYQVELNP
jgi:hypothetical protein